MANKKFNEYLVIFSIIIIPLYTLIYSLKKSPFEYTLSMIGSWFGHKESFIIWGIITAFFITISIINIYKKTKFKNKKAYWFLYISAIFLILTVLTPSMYDEPIPKELRTLNINTHAVLGVLFAVFLITSLLFFSKYLSSIDKELSIKSLKLIILTVGGSILTLVIFGMTGLFELFFFISLSIFLIIINKQLKKKI